MNLLFKALLSIAVASARILDDHRPDVVVLLNGLFLFESVVMAQARRRSVRVVTYERAFVHGDLFFAHDAPACRWDVDDLWAEVRDRPLTVAQDRRLDEYLADRRQGLHAQVQLWPAPVFETATTGSRADVRVVGPSSGCSVVCHATPRPISRR